ncbi:EpsG family protein [Alkalibacterium putridalgicola]|uniref:EpsG family protein n=1 Tax=Alkalibacterium putridalgicola TaxID=426703 RepID=UPI0034CE237D
MTLLLYLTVVLTNGYYALKKRSNQILVVLTLLFIFFIMSGAGPFYSFQADYDNYYRNYYSVLDRGLLHGNQVGYAILITIGNFLGIPFPLFRLIVIAACIGLLYKYVIKRYQVNVNYILVLYMLYAIIIDSEQYRNWIALTVLLSGLHFLETSLWKDKLKFFLVWLISISFHYSFVFYAPLLLVNGKQHNKWIKRLVIAALMLSLIILLNGNEIPFQQLIIDAVNNEDIETYLTTRTNFGFLIPTIMHGSSVFLAFWSRKIIHNKYYGRELNALPNDPEFFEERTIRRELTVSNIIFWINVSMLMIFPLYLVNVQFYRLMRSLLLITYVVCAKASQHIIRRTPNILFNAMVLGSVFVWLFLDLVHRIAPGRLLIPFFFENLL